MKEIYYHDLNVPSLLADVHLEAKAKEINWSPLDNLDNLEEVNLDGDLLIINPTSTELESKSYKLKSILEKHPKTAIIFVAPGYKEDYLASSVGMNHENVSFFYNTEKLGFMASIRNELRLEGGL